jgi:hypothetical protein
MIAPPGVLKTKVWLLKTKVWLLKTKVQVSETELRVKHAAFARDDRSKSAG